MYRALYRKWRPATFSDVVGQKSIVEALQNQLLHDKVGHAYLFTGTRGTGKTTCAKIFAKAVNCPSRNGADPCCTCTICTGIDDGSVMDVVEIDAASNNGVDNIRDLREETAYTPSVASYKVYIIDEVHMLSTAAFNALLKIMEEPPSHVIFILATTEIHKVPATILSRCQRYDFMRIAPEDITGRLQYVASQEGIVLTDEAAGLIARLADGALRDALSILDTCAGVTADVDVALVRRMAGVTDKGYLFAISEAAQRHDAPQALALIAQLREKSIDIKRLCDELILHYRNLLLAGVAGGQRLLTGVSAEEEQRYLAAAQNARPAAETIFAIQTLSDALDKMGKGTDPRIELELALFTLCGMRTDVQTAPHANLPTAKQPSAVCAAIPAAPAAAVPQAALSTESKAQDEREYAEAPPPAFSGENRAQPLKTEPAKAPSGKETLFPAWGEVLEAMKERDGLLYANLLNSKAYHDGKRVLIDGSDLFLEYMRKNEYSTALIKKIIADVTGVQCGIGPYPKKAVQTKPQNIAQENLEQLTQLGVPVEYQDE